MALLRAHTRNNLATLSRLIEFYVTAHSQAMTVANATINGTISIPNHSSTFTLRPRRVPKGHHKACKLGSYSLRNEYHPKEYC